MALALIILSFLCCLASLVAWVLLVFRVGALVDDMERTQNAVGFIKEELNELKKDGTRQ